jgi:phosphoribosylaminoimidazolecarboxamide formyltransferase/IMP cyclohydrolase
VEAGAETDDELTPGRLELDLMRTLVPRYGENPHQQAAVYRTGGGPGLLGGFDQLQGKELSWNNLLDADAARKLVGLFDEPTVVIVKHNNPCGVGRGDTLAEAYQRALAGDPVSAFGSIVALNRPADEDLAEAMRDLFVEVIVAPDYDEDARARFGKKKNLRLLSCPIYRSAEGLELRAIDGGFLAQTPDVEPDEVASWKCVTEAAPTDAQLRALDFNWKVCRYVKSNAIVVGGENQTLGVGAGQMSRVDSCRLALEKSEESAAGAVAASDAFFPFSDGVELLAEGGIEAIVQPGGSKRDDEVVAAANRLGIAMMFTGRRHFKH